MYWSNYLAYLPTMGIGQMLPLPVCKRKGHHFSNGRITQRHVCGALFHSTVTCKDLTQPSEVEESTLRHGEQLAEEHQEGDRGEDHRENHQDLNCLKPL